MYVTFFSNNILCNVMRICVHQLVGENEINYHLSAENKIGNIAFLNI